MYKIITDLKQITDLQNDITTTEVIGLDLETWGLDVFQDKVRLLCLATDNTTYIIDVENCQDPKLFKYVIDLIEASGKTVVGHNIKFDLKFIFHATRSILSHIWDTSVAEVLLTAGVGPQYPSLQDLVLKYCDEEIYKDTRLNFATSEVITEEMYQYASNDVKYLKDIMMLQIGDIELKKLTKVLTLESRLIPIVMLMEYDGVLLDRGMWTELHNASIAKMEEAHERFMEELTKRLKKHIYKCGNALEAYHLLSMPKSSLTKKLTKFLEELTDKEAVLEYMIGKINLNSPIQLKKVLGFCDYPNLSSTAKGFLEALDKDILIRSLLDYRFYSKRVVAFGLNWLEHIHPVTGRIHPEYNQVGTVTGRWSSNKPNMQNIIADEEYRACFVAREGYSLITADYSQAELRLLGAVSGDETIIEAYMNDEDIHAKTASIIYEVPLEEVTKEQRSIGKTINFAIVYGAGASRIANQVGNISILEASKLLKKFFTGYPKVKVFIDLASKMIWERRYSKTPFGRIRFFSDENTVFEDEHEYHKVMSRVMREGVNLIIQGGSADALKIAIVDSYYENPWGHDKFRFLIQVHDEVVVEVHDSIKEEAEAFLKSNMENAEAQFLKGIPAVVDSHTKKHWTKG